MSRPVEWSIGPGGIARVDAAGFVHALAEGTGRLVATVDDVSDTATVRVSARPLPPGPGPGRGSGGAVAPTLPLSATHVDAAAEEVMGAITSKDTAGVRKLYAGTSPEDVRRRDRLVAEMQQANNGVREATNAPTVAPRLQDDGERPTARISRTLEFAARGRRPPKVLLDLELTFRRDGPTWRLAGFRIVNTPTYR